MCDPVSLAVTGAVVGAGIGYSKGGAKGALIGGVLGGAGGYFGASALGIGGGFDAAGLISAGGSYGSGGSLLNMAGGAFGSGGLGSFLSSPGAALGGQVLGFGFQAYTNSQNAAFQRSQIAFQQAELRNNIIVAGYNKEREDKQEALRQTQIGREGDQLHGRQRVTQAALGQLVDTGSAADITAQTSADTAYKKLLSRNESDFRKYQFDLEARGLEANSAALGAQAQNVTSANQLNTFGAGLTAAGKINKRFTFDGGLAFRT